MMEKRSASLCASIVELAVAFRLRVSLPLMLYFRI